MRDLSPLAQRVIRVYTGRKFSFKYLINRAEGQAMAQYIVRGGNRQKLKFNSALKIMIKEIFKND